MFEVKKKDIMAEKNYLYTEVKQRNKADPRRVTI